MSTNEELIKEIQNGNEYAMEVLIKRHYKLIFSFIYRNVGIFVISANIFDIYNNKFWYYGVNGKPMDDPEKQTSYKPHNWKDLLSFVAHIPEFSKYYEP